MLFCLTLEHHEHGIVGSEVKADRCQPVVHGIAERLNLSCLGMPKRRLQAADAERDVDGTCLVPVVANPVDIRIGGVAVNIMQLRGITGADIGTQQAQGIGDGLLAQVDDRCSLLTQSIELFDDGGCHVLTMAVDDKHAIATARRCDELPAVVTDQTHEGILVQIVEVIAKRNGGMMMGKKTRYHIVLTIII